MPPKERTYVYAWRTRVVMPGITVTSFRREKATPSSPPSSVTLVDRSKLAVLQPRRSWLGTHLAAG